MLCRSPVVASPIESHLSAKLYVLLQIFFNNREVYLKEADRYPRRGHPPFPTPEWTKAVANWSDLKRTACVWDCAILSPAVNQVDTKMILFRCNLLVWNKRYPWVGVLHWRILAWRKELIWNLKPWWSLLEQKWDWLPDGKFDCWESKSAGSLYLAILEISSMKNWWQSLFPFAVQLQHQL